MPDKPTGYSNPEKPGLFPFWPIINQDGNEITVDEIWVTKEELELRQKEMLDAALAEKEL